MTDVPGTTRDHIDVPLALAGVPVRLTDTAGLRDSSDEVERIGVDRARGLIDAADVLIWLGGPGDAPEHPRQIQVHARCDIAERGSAPLGSVAVSVKTGEGLAELVKAITELAKALLPAENQLALNCRQAECVADARESLLAAAATGDVVMLAESLRSARSAFDRLTGHAGVEDLLDALFGRFCLGK